MRTNLVLNPHSEDKFIHMESKDSISSTPTGESPNETSSILHNRSTKHWTQVLKRHLILVLTILGVVLGITLGALLSTIEVSDKAIELIGFPGELLLRMLKMLVLPLIASSIIVGITALGSKNSMGFAEKRMFVRTMIYFGCTTIAAVILGIAIVSIIRPGNYSASRVPIDVNDPDDTNDGPIPPNVDTLQSILDVFRSMFPDNLALAAVNMDVLGVITFSVVLGGTMIVMGDKSKPLSDLFESVNEAIMKIVMLVMWYAPLGIMSLIAARLGENPNFLAVLSDIAMFAVTVVGGLVIHAGIVLPLVYWVLTRRNPFRFYAGMLQAILTAIGTDSSAATLPIAMKCVNELGVDPKISQIVMPLGVTLNMNGTALYEAVAAMFVAQLYSIPLNAGQTIVVAITSTIAAIGAAGIPEAGLITMTIVFTAVGLPLDAIGFLLTIDWLLDRCRTVVNVLGDAIGAAIVSRYYERDLLLKDSQTATTSSAYVSLE